MLICGVPMKNIGLWVAGVVVVAGIGWFVWKVATAPVLSDEDLQRQELASCVQHNGVGMHIHPELSITIKGEKMEIPANTGITGGCMHPIHTHDDSGMLHLEFKTPRDVKVSEFFEMWGKRFDSECILDNCNGPDGTVKMKVNGQESTEFGNAVMRDHDQIEIVFE